MRSPKLHFLDPTVMFDIVESEKEPIPSDELFNKPQHKPLLDRWRAASFGVGYQKYIAGCKVAMSAPGAREDFFLLANGREFPFQTVSVQEEGRRLGDEYRRPPGLTPWRPALGTEGLRWLETGIRKKADKRYARSNDLNILVYMNFNSSLEWDAVTVALTPFRETFASLWLMAYHLIGTVFSTPDLGSVEKCMGWRKLRAAPDWKIVT
jgi:hypothetical protein